MTNPASARAVPPVIGAEQLVALFGYWPMFHDARVLALQRCGDAVDASIHVFQMTSELDERGYFVLRQHHHLLLRMEGVREDTLPAPYPGDVLDRLHIEAEGALLRVRFDSHMDNDGSVLCARVSIAALKACDAHGEPV